MACRVKQELDSKIDTAAKQGTDGSSVGLDQLKSSAEALQAKLAEIEGKIASERAETGSQLDALRGQMQREAAEEAKKAATAVADDVKSASQPPPDVKGTVDQILMGKMADLKAEIDGELQGQMQVRSYVGATLGPHDSVILQVGIFYFYHLASSLWPCLTR